MAIDHSRHRSTFSLGLRSGDIRAQDQFENAAIFLALVAIGIIGVALVIYLTWDPVGADEVGGFHGRYFLPFLPFAMVSIANGTLKNIRWCWPVAFITCLLSNLVALGLLARATFS